LLSKCANYRHNMDVQLNDWACYLVPKPIAQVIVIRQIVPAIPPLISLAIFGEIQNGNKRSFEYLTSRLTPPEERIG